ncbi:MAG: hypothetical protein KJ634_13605 [Gammaproteobacteria bacterium]|nr:hypothetical protein [Gammaproteobacteria bacterium]
MPGMHRFLRATIRLAMAFSVLGSTVATADTNLKEDLEHIASRRILFGHQSVGANVLEGVQELAKAAGVPLHIVEVSTTAGVTPATFEHFLVAENGKPLKKLESFETTMGIDAGIIDVALVKFCFVDFSADTDAKALFAKYRAMIERLKARHPETTFVHVTAPLTDVQSGVKGWVKRLVGRAPYGVLENMRRNEYSELIRSTYSGHEPIFDLARIESSGPDGQTVTTEWEEKHTPILAPQYTDDGGHLNSIGRFRAAREFLSILAGVQKRPSAAQSSLLNATR